MDMETEDLLKSPDLLSKSLPQGSSEDAEPSNMLEISEEELQVVEGYLLPEVLNILGM